MKLQENEKLGTITFKGGMNDKNTYLLAIHNNVVRVIRNFQGDVNKQGGVPSGWRLENCVDKGTLCIDWGQKWFVYPSVEAWEEIKVLAKKD